MKVNSYCFSRKARMSVRVMMLMLLAGLGVAVQPAGAQVRYVYFPTPSVTDGHMLSIAGEGIQTLGNTIYLKLASSGSSSQMRLGIFDGETGGTWDQGTTPLEFTLFADPAADGSGTFQVAQWNGNIMPDNAWFSTAVTNVPQAKTPCGDYFYILRVRSTDPSVMSWSSFKVRTDGTISALARAPITYAAPMGSAADAAIIYPNYPSLTPTTYDGVWKFFVELATPATSFTMWDGDLDYGSYDCSVNDDDDPDTSNDDIAEWMEGTDAVPEGVAEGGVDCVGAGGSPTTGTTTSNPPDDARLPIFRRSPSVTYDVIAPNGITYTNNNPSGNLEWEQFRIATGTFKRSEMDYQAASLPSGIYQIKVQGVDLSNLNAFRFLQDALGVDSAGLPVSMIVCSAQPVQGVISGTVSLDANRNRKADAGEMGIKNVQVYLDADYNNDGRVDNTLSTTTDADGKYAFGPLPVGKYKVRIDITTLPDDVEATYDSDGLSTLHTAAAQITAAKTEYVLNFGYAPECVPGTATVSYWRSNTDKWPVGTMKLGNVTYTKSQLMNFLSKSSNCGDNTYILAQQLITAKLNLLMGNDGSSICDRITAGDNWLRQYPIGKNASRSAWSTGDAIRDRLESYNYGYLGAKHRDRVNCGRNNDRPKWCRDSNDDKDGKPRWWNCKDQDDRNSKDKARDLLDWLKRFR